MESHDSEADALRLITRICVRAILRSGLNTKGEDKSDKTSTPLETTLRQEEPTEVRTRTAVPPRRHL